MTKTVSYPQSAVYAFAGDHRAMVLYGRRLHCTNACVSSYARVVAEITYLLDRGIEEQLDAALRGVLRAAE